MISLDSDVVFLRKFNAFDLSRDGRVSFYRVPEAYENVLPDRKREHAEWSKKAGALLGIDRPESTTTGYIGTLIAWRTDTVREMVTRIEHVAGRSWVRALAGTRKLSECTLYGRFVDEIEGRPDRHRPSGTVRCKVYWAGRPLDREGLDEFIAALGPEQVAAGFQSFTNTDIGLIRRAAGLA